MRLAARLAALGLLLLTFVAAYGYGEATRVPRVVRYEVSSPHWMAAPVRIALLSDTHATPPDMTPVRLVEVVRAVNTLKPDIVLLGGDYISQRPWNRGYGEAVSVAPFAALRAPLGVYAVLGNHDMRWPEAAARIEAALRSGGVRVLRNQAERTAAGFWVVGLDDPRYGTPRPAAAFATVPAGAPVMELFHNPDNFEPQGCGAALALAGHTHGGQIAPWPLGAIYVPVRHKDRVRGLYDYGACKLLVTSGVGATFLPVRIAVPPEIVLITLSSGGRR